MYDHCMKCGKPLSSDEVGLHKKLYGKTATSFMCIQCNAAHLEVSVGLLQEKIAQFKATGCVLFSQQTRKA